MPYDASTLDQPGHAEGRSLRRALVLSGGGARGAYEAGVVTAICERERFDIFCGTSIGAINAAIAAQDATDGLRALWRGVPERSVIRGASPIEEFLRVLGRGAPHKRRTLRQFGRDLKRAIAALPLAHPRRMRRMTHLLDPAPLVDMLSVVLDHSKLKRTLVIGVTNLTRARPEAFYWFPPGNDEFERSLAARETGSVELTSENFLQAILASAAIPLAYPKVSLAGQDGVVCDYIDGGIGNNTPIRQAIDAGADEITVVIADHVSLRDRDHTIEDIGSIALAAQDIMQQQVLELDLKLTRRVNEAVLAGAAPGKRFVRLRTIGPSIAIPLPILGFADLATIERAFDQGLVDGRDASESTGLDRLFKLDPSARRIAASESVYEEGDGGEAMYVVIEGEFELSVNGRTIATLYQGDTFGELSLLGFGPRRGRVRAKTDATIAPVDAARFAYLVRYAPSFATTVLRSLGAILGDLPDTKKSPLIDRLKARPGTTAHLDAFRENLPVRAVAAGDAVFDVGDPGHGMFVVIAGEVQIETDGGETLTTVSLGQVFGELALCDQLPRTTRATAVTDAEVVFIDVLRFTEVAQDNPAFAIEVMRTMAERIIMQIDGVELQSAV